MDEAGFLLIESPHKIGGLRYEPAAGLGSAGFLQLGDDRAELAGPRTPGEDTDTGNLP
ncbi:hypothetical protein SRABI128_05113 [Microbacterium sp. Bi128]|nr:hypothetical protein SRABI128_05113 [Microbacterium sp. Bi128]